MRRFPHDEINPADEMSECPKIEASDEPLAGHLRGSKPALKWLIWLVGTAACMALILVVTHLADQREFLRLLQTIEPLSLGLAVLLQSSTYLAQAFVWRLVARSTGHLMPMGKAYELSLAMLFVNQALPSAGISGVALVSGAMSHAGIPRAVIVSTVLIDTAMYYLAYAFLMAGALIVTLYSGYFPIWVSAVMLVFIGVGFGVTRFLLTLPGNRTSRLKTRLRRFPKLANLIDWADQAHAESFRNKRVLSQAFACHVVIFLLDAATVWVAVRALGVTAPMDGVLSSFMASTLFRTIGIMPGGLGTFETASVMSLKSIGLELPVALSATLLFRGLSFWLPMLPGLICSRRLLAKTKDKVN